MDSSDLSGIVTLDALFGNSPEATIIIQDEVVVYANPAVTMTGLELDAIIGNSYLNLIPEEYQEEAKELVNQHLGGAKLRESFESPLIGPSGETVYFRYLATAIDLDGEPALLVFIRDNTEMREMRQKMDRLEERNRTVLDAISDPINIKDADNRFVWVNEAQARVMGLESEDIIGERCMDLGYCTNDCETCDHRLFFDDPRSTEEVAEGPDGKYWHIRREPLVGDNGDVEAVLEVSREVTNRIYYENKLEALHEYVRRLNTASNIIEVGEYTLDTIEGVMGYIHTGFGLVKDDVVEFPLIRDNESASLEISYHDDSPVIEAVKSGSLVCVPDLSETFKYQRFVPHSVQCSSELNVPVSIGGEVVAVINLCSSHRDVFTEEDKRLVSLLSIHVSSALQRIYALENMDHINEVMAKETIEGIQRISRKYAEDLRKPLKKIRGACYELWQKDIDEDSLEVIDEGVREAQMILDVLLDQTMAQEVTRIPQDINELLDKAVERVYVPGSIRVKRRYFDEFIAQSVDPVKIRQAFINVIKNAVDAMPDGGVLTLTTRRVGRDTEVRITDSGIGIRDEDMEDVFKPFYTTKPKGFGLGLAYCKRVIEAHGGSINLDSEQGEGTTVVIRLPVGSI
jgi:PAS domain S-box-containing protein